MRVLLVLFLLLPVIANAQINRSATEFAKENVQEYLSKKVFKDQPYKPGVFSELKSHVQVKAGIAWTIDHKFEISEKQKDAHQNSINVQKPYKFIFYLSDKMKVVRAESYLVI